MMTFYLGLRMFTFEQEQITTLIARQLRMRESSIAHQFESTIDLNHKLVSQLSEILTAVQKLVHETKVACRHIQYTWWCQSLPKSKISCLLFLYLLCNDLQFFQAKFLVLVQSCTTWTFIYSWWDPINVFIKPTYKVPFYIW